MLTEERQIGPEEQPALEGGNGIAKAMPCVQRATCPYRLGIGSYSSSTETALGKASQVHTFVAELARTPSPPEARAAPCRSGVRLRSFVVLLAFFRAEGDRGETARRSPFKMERSAFNLNGAGPPAGAKSRSRCGEGGSRLAMDS